MWVPPVPPVASLVHPLRFLTLTLARTELPAVCPLQFGFFCLGAGSWEVVHLLWALVGAAWLLL